MENYKEQYTNNKRRQKNWNWNGYVLSFMVVTCDTAHFETSLLNADASENAVQIIHNKITTTEKKETKNTNTKEEEEENWK